MLNLFRGMCCTHLLACEHEEKDQRLYDAASQTAQLTATSVLQHANYA